MKESPRIEFKQSWRDEWMKWVCGFANARGGRLPCLFFCALFLAAGCGREKRPSIARRVGGAVKSTAASTGKFVGENAGAFFAGVAEGAESIVVDYDVRVSDALAASGVRVNLVKRRAPAKSGETPALVLYVLSRDAVPGTLRIRLLDATDREIGRSTAAADLAADDGRYVAFPLDGEVPAELVKTVSLESL